MTRDPIKSAIRSFMKWRRRQALYREVPGYREIDQEQARLRDAHSKGPAHLQDRKVAVMCAELAREIGYRKAGKVVR